MTSEAGGREPEVRIQEDVTAEEAAAVVAAVLAGKWRAPSRRPSPWLQAALREGLGGKPAAEPSDLRSTLGP